MTDQVEKMRADLPSQQQQQQPQGEQEQQLSSDGEDIELLEQQDLKKRGFFCGVKLAKVFRIVEKCLEFTEGELCVAEYCNSYWKSLAKMYKTQDEVPGAKYMEKDVRSLHSSCLSLEYYLRLLSRLLHRVNKNLGREKEAAEIIELVQEAETLGTVLDDMGRQSLLVTKETTEEDEDLVRLDAAVRLLTDRDVPDSSEPPRPRRQLQRLEMFVKLLKFMIENQKKYRQKVEDLYMYAVRPSWADDTDK